MYHLSAGEPVADGVRAVARDQLDRALAAIDDVEVGLHESVHEARKRCKKVRAVLRLVRDDVPDSYQEANAELRDIGRLVSDERDAGAHVEAHDLLVDELGDTALAPYTGIRERLVAFRDGEAAERIEQRLGEVRQRLATARSDVADWELPEGDGVDVLRQGYQRTYQRARARWRDATTEPSSSLWHQWRKRVKYNRYHTNLLQEAWKPVMELREELCHDLTDHLGDDNDLWELRLAVTGQGKPGSGSSRRTELEVDDAQLLTGYVALIDGLRTRRQHDALPLAARLYGQPVDEHVDMVFAWWGRAVEETRGEALDQDELTPVVPHGS